MQNTDLNAQILEEASEWFVSMRLDQTDPAERARFDAWLTKSPEHVRAYLDIASIWADVSGVDPGRIVDARTLIARARAQDNVLPLDRASSSLERESRGEDPHLLVPAGEVRREDPSSLPPAETGSGEHSLPLPRAGEGGGEGTSIPRRFLLAASLAVVFIAGGVYWWQVGRGPTYVTEVGEQRSLTLADGSRVELNARSRIHVHFSDTERVVDLLEGQGLFRVAKDPQRPFIVRTDTARVRAVGTQFDVYRKASGTTVTVLEGQVEVASGAAAAVPLIAGEQVIVQADRIAKPTPANMAATTAWTQKQLVFDSASLAEVAQEFNRYNTRPLVIDDVQGDFHISGVFSSADPASLLTFLSEQPGFTVEETETEIRITRNH